MAGYRIPTPLGLCKPETGIDDGTMIRTWSPLPGPVGLSSGLKQSLERIKALVIFFGGANDASHKNMHSVYDDYENGTNHQKEYLSWIAGKTAKMRIVNQLVNVSLETPVCLIGHSYGGDTAMDVARELSSVSLDIQLLVTLDPVSNFAPVQQVSRPQHVDKWINVWVNTTNSLKLDNMVAEFGGHWGPQLEATEDIQCKDASHAQAYKMFKKVKKDVLFFEHLTKVNLNMRKTKLKLYEIYLKTLLEEK